MAKLNEASYHVKGYSRVDIPEPDVKPSHPDLAHISKWTDEVRGHPEFHRFEKSGDYIYAKAKGGRTLGTINSSHPEWDAHIDGMEYHHPSKRWVDEHSEDGQEAKAAFPPDVAPKEYWSFESASYSGSLINEATEKLVDALAVGSASGIESSFKEAMSKRLLDTIDAERPNVVTSLFDENGVFQKEEFTTEAKSNGAPAACPHCLKKVSGKGVYHNPPKVKVELGIEQAGFYHAKCHKKKFPDAVVEEFDLMESEEVLSEMAVPWPEKAPQLNQYKRTAQGSNVYAHPDGHRIELNPDTQELTHFPAGSTKGKKFAAGADIHPYLMKLHGGFDDLVKKHDADASRSWGDDMRMRHKMGSLDYAYKKAKKAGTLTPEDHAKMAVDYKAMHRAVMNGQKRERIAARAKYNAFNQTKVYKEEKEAASRCVNCGEDYHGDAEKQKYHSNCWSDAGIAARKKSGDLGESASYGTPGCAGCENDTYNGVCMDCTRARAKTATSRGGCKCGKKKVPGEVKKAGSRSWIPCERCLGQIAQLS